MGLDQRFVTSDGDTYAYDYIPAKGNKATFLLIHGYPASRHDWRYQIADLTAAGFGVIAPDCLGYGDTDKPADIEAYHFKRLSGHFIQLLDHENLEQVIGVGHDWGSTMLSRAAVWHPERFQKLVFLSAGYSPPGIFFDVDNINALSMEHYGYTQLGYWYFLNSYDTKDVMAEHLESFFHLAYPMDNSLWASNLAAIGSARAWLSANTMTSLPSWLTEDDKTRWLRVNKQKNAVEAPLNYYRSLMRGTQVEDEKALTDAHRTLKVPVLGVGGSEDQVTRADQLKLGIGPWATKGYTEKVIDGAGHWILLEAKEVVSSALLEFAERDA